MSPHACRNADIILNGSPDPYLLSAQYPSHSTIIEGGYHSPFPNGTAIVANAVHGLVVRANACGDGLDDSTGDGSCQNVSLLDIGTSNSWYAVDVSMVGNTGWSNPSGHVRLIHDRGSQYRGGSFHTFQDTSISHRLNFLKARLAPSPWEDAIEIPGMKLPSVHVMAPFDGQAVRRIEVAAAAASSGMILLELHLANAPSIAGQSCYFALRVSVSSPASGIALMIDRGDGQFAVVSSDSDASSLSTWATQSTQATLLESGVARFAVKLFGKNASALVSSAIVAPVGLHWNDAEE